MGWERRREGQPVNPGPVRVVLTVLGGFGLHSRGHGVTVAPAGQRLLTYLAIARRQTTRSSVAATLWPDGTDGQAAANLRSTLRRLPRPDDVSLVTAGPSHLSLPPWIGVDLWEAQDLLGRLDEVRTEAEVRLLHEDLLPDWFPSGSTRRASTTGSAGCTRSSGCAGDTGRPATTSRRSRRASRPSGASRCARPPNANSSRATSRRANTRRPRGSTRATRGGRARGSGPPPRPR